MKIKYSKIKLQNPAAGPHRGNLFQEYWEWGGQSRPWVLGNLTYEGLNLERWGRFV